MKCAPKSRKTYRAKGRMKPSTYVDFRWLGTVPHTTYLTYIRRFDCFEFVHSMCACDIYVYIHIYIYIYIYIYI